MEFLKTKHVHAEPIGVCCKSIDFDISLNDLTIFNVKFTGGCNGNLSAIASLCEGMNPLDIIEKCENIKCGSKSTSCPAKLAKAIVHAITSEEINLNEFKVHNITE